MDSYGIAQRPASNESGPGRAGTAHGNRASAQCGIGELGLHRAVTDSEPTGEGVCASQRQQPRTSLSQRSAHPTIVGKVASKSDVARGAGTVLRLNDHATVGGAELHVQRRAPVPIGAQRAALELDRDRQVSRCGTSGDALLAKVETAAAQLQQCRRGSVESARFAAKLNAVGSYDATGLVHAGEVGIIGRARLKKVNPVVGATSSNRKRATLHIEPAIGCGRVADTNLAGPGSFGANIYRGAALHGHSRSVRDGSAVSDAEVGIADGGRRVVAVDR